MQNNNVYSTAACGGYILGALMGLSNSTVLTEIWGRELTVFWLLKNSTEWEELSFVASYSFNVLFFFLILIASSLACVQFVSQSHFGTYLPNPTVFLSPQNFLRCQNNKNNYNLVCETLQFLDCICGSTTGGLGLLGLYINEKNVALINQTLESLTEYCQGPCHENQVHRDSTPEREGWDWTMVLSVFFIYIFFASFLQNCIATHESNGIDIIIALILNDINPLGKKRMDLVLELKVSVLGWCKWNVRRIYTFVWNWGMGQLRLWALGPK